jgi:hypothetical protein
MASVTIYAKGLTVEVIDNVPPPTTGDLASTVIKDSDLRNNPDVLQYLEFSSVQQVNSDLGKSNWADGDHRPWASPSFLPDGSVFCVSDPEFLTVNGFPVMRFSGGNTNQRIIAASLWAGPGIREAYCRYVLKIGSDVPQFMTELGVKLPGFDGSYEDTVIHPPHAGTQTFSWRMEHGPKDNIDLRDYLYDGVSGQGFGNIKLYGVPLKVDDYLCVEQYLNIDTKKGKVWLNDIFVGDRDIVADVDIERMFLNIYHGGLGFSTQPIHYELGGAVIATKKIGIPPELRTVVPPAATDEFPKWRAGAVKDVPMEIPNTFNMNGTTDLGNGTTTGSNTLNAWQGMASGLTTINLIGNSGHDQGNGNGWENKRYEIDLAADVPVWQMKHPGSPRDMVTATSDHYLDGGWVGCHSYYLLQHIESKNKIMRFGCAAAYAIGFPPVDGVAPFQGGPIVDGFDIKLNTWDKPHTWANIPPYQGTVVQSVCKHPVTEDVYIADNEAFFRWNNSDGTFTDLAPSIKSGPNYQWQKGCWQFSPSLIDVQRNRWVHLNNYVAPSLLFVNLTNPSGWDEIVITGLSSIDNYAGLTYDEDNDRYLTVQGSNLYGINPDTGVATVICVAAPSINGTQNKLAYFKKLGGVVYIARFENNLWFLPTR